MNSYNLKLIEELKEFLAENRRNLTGNDVLLINQVIDRLKKVKNSNAVSYQRNIVVIVNIIEIIIKLLEIHR